MPMLDKMAANNLFIKAWSFFHHINIRLKWIHCMKMYKYCNVFQTYFNIICNNLHINSSHLLRGECIILQVFCINHDFIHNLDCGPYTCIFSKLDWNQFKTSFRQFIVLPRRSKHFMEKSILGVWMEFMMSYCQ